MLNLLLGHGKIIAGENSQVGQLAWGESSLFSVFRREPTAPHRVELECFRSIQSILFRIKTQTANGLSGDKPVEGKVRVVARNAGCVGTCADRNTYLKHAPDRRSAFSLPGTISLDEIFSLKGHSILHCDPTAQRFHALDVMVCDRFAVIKEPVQAVKGNLLVHLFIDI